MTEETRKGIRASPSHAARIFFPINGFEEDANPKDANYQF